MKAYPPEKKELVFKLRCERLTYSAIARVTKISLPAVIGWTTKEMKKHTPLARKLRSIDLRGRKASGNSKSF